MSESGVRRGAHTVRFVAMALGAVLCAQLAACSGIYTKRLVFTQAQLQKKADKAFPLKKRKSLVTIEFVNPQILLTTGGDRIGIGLDMRVSVPGSKRTDGHLEADGGLAYRPESGEFLFTDGRMRRIDIVGLPKKYSGTIEAVAAKLVKAYLSEIVVYRLDQGDFKHSLAKLVLKSVAVVNGEIVVEIGL